MNPQLPQNATRPAWAIPPTWITVHCMEPLCQFKAIRQDVAEAIARIEEHGQGAHGWTPTSAA